ncbi:MAG TPA: DNA primase [Candidatus Saccharimonadales bacterium]|nr:DNA primase [Candidatus Saccharimonadales bacterium]
MDAVEDIKQRLSIEEVISDYVELKRAGRNWKGLSPFSSERSPSFMVSPEKQIWHDFSSGKGGNMFSFVMEMEGLDFKGALELLARKAGVDLTQYRSSGSGQRSKEKERLYDAMLEATRYYYGQLRLPQNKEAYDYVHTKRQFTEQTVLEWRIGYSPSGGEALVKHLVFKGFKAHEIIAAGLATKRYRSLRDMFRGRIMIPLADPQGRVIGFTARLLKDDPNAPKYINTPQTPLYDKSRHVFGLHLAKEGIRKSKFVVIAEGNLDVISSHQAGIRQVVATAGTALTEYQLKALGRFTGDIRLSFDADKAGVNATERAIPIASKVNVSLSIINIPSGKDPDELIKQDVNAWRQTIEKPKYALDWLMGKYQKQLDITTAQGKREFSDVLLTVIRGLADGVEQEHYIDEISKCIGVSREALLIKLHQKEAAAKPKLKQPKGEFKLPSKEILDYMKTQNHLLAIALMQPKLRRFIEPVTAAMMHDDNARQLLTFLQANPDFSGQAAKVEELLSIGDYVKILSLHYEELYQDVETHELEYETSHVLGKLIGQYVKMQKQRIAHELQTADEEKQLTLLHKVKELDNLLKTHKGGA